MAASRFADSMRADIPTSIPSDQLSNSPREKPVFDYRKLPSDNFVDQLPPLQKRPATLPPPLDTPLVELRERACLAPYLQRFRTARWPLFVGCFVRAPAAATGDVVPAVLLAVRDDNGVLRTVAAGHPLHVLLGEAAGLRGPGALLAIRGTALVRSHPCEPAYLVRLSRLELMGSLRDAEDTSAVQHLAVVAAAGDSVPDAPEVLRLLTGRWNEESDAGAAAPAALVGGTGDEARAILLVNSFSEAALTRCRTAVDATLAAGTMVVTVGAAAGASRTGRDPAEDGAAAAALHAAIDVAAAVPGSTTATAPVSWEAAARAAEAMRHAGYPHWTSEQQMEFARGFTRFGQFWAAIRKAMPSRFDLAASGDYAAASAASAAAFKDTPLTAVPPPPPALAVAVLAEVGQVSDYYWDSLPTLSLPAHLLRRRRAGEADRRFHPLPQGPALSSPPASVSPGADGVGVTGASPPTPPAHPAVATRTRRAATASSLDNDAARASPALNDDEEYNTMSEHEEGVGSFRNVHTGRKQQKASDQQLLQQLYFAERRRRRERAERIVAASAAASAGYDKGGAGILSSLRSPLMSHNSQEASQESASLHYAFSPSNMQQQQPYRGGNSGDDGDNGDEARAQLASLFITYGGRAAAAATAVLSSSSSSIANTTSATATVPPVKRGRPKKQLTYPFMKPRASSASHGSAAPSAASVFAPKSAAATGTAAATAAAASLYGVAAAGDGDDFQSSASVLKRKREEPAASDGADGRLVFAADGRVDRPAAVTAATVPSAAASSAPHASAITSHLSSALPAKKRKVGSHTSASAGGSATTTSSGDLATAAAVATAASKRIPRTGSGTEAPLRYRDDMVSDFRDDIGVGGVGAGGKKGALGGGGRKSRGDGGSDSDDGGLKEAIKASLVEAQIAAVRAAAFTPPAGAAAAAAAATTGASTGKPVEVVVIDSDDEGEAGVVFQHISPAPVDKKVAVAQAKELDRIRRQQQKQQQTHVKLPLLQHGVGAPSTYNPDLSGVTAPHSRSASSSTAHSASISPALSSSALPSTALPRLLQLNPVTATATCQQPQQHGPDRQQLLLGGEDDSDGDEAVASPHRAGGAPNSPSASLLPFEAVVTAPATTIVASPKLSSAAAEPCALVAPASGGRGRSAARSASTASAATATAATTATASSAHAEPHPASSSSSGGQTSDVFDEDNDDEEEEEGGRIAVVGGGDDGDRIVRPISRALSRPAVTSGGGDYRQEDEEEEGEGDVAGFRRRRSPSSATSTSAASLTSSSTSDALLDFEGAFDNDDDDDDGDDDDDDEVEGVGALEIGREASQASAAAQSTSMSAPRRRATMRTACNLSRYNSHSSSGPQLESPATVVRAGGAGGIGAAASRTNNSSSSSSMVAIGGAFSRVVSAAAAAPAAAPAAALASPSVLSLAPSPCAAATLHAAPSSPMIIETAAVTSAPAVVAAVTDAAAAAAPDSEDTDVTMTMGRGISPFSIAGGEVGVYSSSMDEIHVEPASLLAASATVAAPSSPHIADSSSAIEARSALSVSISELPLAGTSASAPAPSVLLSSSSSSSSSSSVLRAPPVAVGSTTSSVSESPI